MPLQKYTHYQKPYEIRNCEWISEEMGIRVKWPAEIFVDNAAGVSFQHSTNPQTKLKGIFDKRHSWVMELRDKQKVKAMKVETTKNVADTLTKCLPAITTDKLDNEIQLLASQLAVSDLTSSSSNRFRGHVVSLEKNNI